MEKRRRQRTKIRHPGKIFVRGETVHDCTVHNVTGLGVCIEFAFHVEELPDTVDFSFDNFRTVHSCEIIWRQRNLAGVAFRKLPESSLTFNIRRRAKLRVVR
jgi:hypothetical protein